MFLRAGGGERPRHREEDYLFVGCQVGDGDRLELVGGVEVGEGGVRELVADRYGGGYAGDGGESEGLKAADGEWG